MLRRRLVEVSVLLAIMAPRTLAGQDTTGALIRAHVAAARVPGARWPDFPRYVDDVARFYASHGDAPVWLDGEQVSRAGRAVVAELLGAASHGLDPRDYDAATLDSLARQLADSAAGVDRARLDLMLSVDLIRYLDDLHRGRAFPQPAGRPAPAADEPVDWAAAVSRALEADSIALLVAAAAPRLAQYANLRRLLARYRALAADSSIVPLPEELALQPGDTSAVLPALRRRLVALGDLPADTAAGAPPDRYAGAVVEAVRGFQTRHGLTPDGIIGPATLVQLNTPLARRVRQIELALERLRWLPPIGQQRFLVVNIPAFQLYAFDSVGGTGAPSLSMKAVVGKALDTRTPVLFEQMRYVEFQPYWNVPRSILVSEILPILRRDDAYLRTHHMEVVGARDRVIGDDPTPDVLARLARGELRVRQRPGTWNALGLVKFVFPNAASVYMHGTPDTELFEHTRRDFSHGCIRLEDPEALAAWVLRDQPEWTGERVQEAMAGPATTRALLTRPLPVIVFYTTAVATPAGSALFLPDIYGHDADLDEVLRAGPTLP
ncbi:MAG TPA: L,D-transpeptidase family protein [Gemmatimonadales bacterium]|nr:L,D-transpeptidase family protein [Gemmatimonadales bacterium]